MFAAVHLSATQCRCRSMDGSALGKQPRTAEKQGALLGESGHCGIRSVCPLKDRTTYCPHLGLGASRCVQEKSPKVGSWFFCVACQVLHKL